MRVTANIFCAAVVVGLLGFAATGVKSCSDRIDARETAALKACEARGGTIVAMGRTNDRRCIRKDALINLGPL